MTELYVTGVVIANGIPDSDGDVLNKKQIKQIFTKYTIQQTDVQHNYIRNEGVDVLANWITETPCVIGGKSVPAGSWLCTSKVTNEEICDLLINQKLNSYSLGSTPKDEIIPVIEKAMTYSDVTDVDDVQPLFISFVNKGANGYTFEVMSKEVYINKNDKSEDIEMTEKNVEKPIEDEKVSIGGLQKIREIFGISKSDDTAVADEPQQQEAEPVQNVDAEPVVNDDLLNSIEEKVSAGIVAGFKAIKEEEAKEEVNNELKAEIKEETEEKEDEDGEEEAEAKTEPPKINKNDKQTTKTENVEIPETNTNFYKLSGRDAFGCKIKK